MIGFYNDLWKIVRIPSGGPALQRFAGPHLECAAAAVFEQRKPNKIELEKSGKNLLARHVT
jgi:hypothetical protein